MRILYLTQYFGLESEAGSGRHIYFCKYAVNKGNHVIAITSNVDYKNARVKISGKKGVIIRSVEGVEIRYVYSYPNFRYSFFKRIFFFITYLFSSITESIKIKKPDVIYAVSTPLTVGLLGYFVSRYWGIPYIFEVGDVWPDAAVACGVVKNKVIIKLAHWIEIFCYKKAVHIVGLSQNICKNIIGKVGDRKKVSLITNGVDFSIFNLEENNRKRNAVRKEAGFGDRFIAMYMGAHGVYNALDTIINAAIELKNNPQILFVLVGNGDEKPRLQRLVYKNHLKNVIFMPTIPRIESTALLAAADVFLLPNRRGDFFVCNLPNKIFDYLASARPVIVAGFGETSELVLAAECGMIGEAEDSLAMAQSILKIFEMSAEERNAMARRGREYVLRNYDRKSLSDSFLTIVEASLKR